MECSECREVISAHLDGEATDADHEAMLVHQRRCGDCRSFEQTVAAFTRNTRVRAAEAVPDLSAEIMAKVPTAKPPIRVRVWARYGLAVVALTQLVLSLPELLPTSQASAPIHIEHHLGAWDIAMAIGLLVVAWQPDRARGLLPMAIALGGTLLLTGVIDVVSGETLALSEAPHALELAGVTLLWCLARPPIRRPWRIVMTPRPLT